MTASLYTRLSAPFRPYAGAIRAVNRLLTLSVYIAYPALLLFLLLTRDPRLLRAVITPGVAFVALTLLRKWCNAPRPYEVLDITPLIPKDTRGNSFPSRHVFSVFVIDMAFWWVFPPLGGVFLAVGVLIALIRVIGGVHFPRDVLSGAVMGAACGAVGFWLIP